MGEGGIRERPWVPEELTDLIQETVAFFTYTMYSPYPFLDALYVHYFKYSCVSS